MKKITISFFCLLSTISVFSQTPNNVILLLNIGQSNVVGRADADGLNEVAPTPGCFWYKQSTNTLETLVDGIGEGISRATDRSMNPMLGKRIKELTGQDVIIVPAGVGNTSISSWGKADNSLYPRAKTMWEAALGYCAANGITVSNKYIHWLQGENDALTTETDGYYVALNRLVGDLMTDFNVEKVFGTRIGYDPNYATAANSEKIMKAQKLLNFNNANFILATNIPATFSFANGHMRADNTHYTLLAENEVAQAIATTIQLYRTTGNKPTLIEPVASLQSVTNGYINLNPNWTLDFTNSLAENDNNVILRAEARDWQPAPTPVYNSEGIVLNNYALETSRPFSSNTFTIEMRLKMNSTSAWTCLLGPQARGGDNPNKLLLSHNTTTSAAYVQFGTATDIFNWDLGTTVNMSSYHTLKLTQAGGILKLFVDGVQRGSDKASNGTLTFSWLGSGSSPDTDMNGVFDFVKITNSVDGALPLKFKSFKATNIK